MLNQIKKITSYILILLPLFSCGISGTYQSIEREDNKKCVSQGFNYGDWDEVITEMYWRCRYRLIQDRKIDGAIMSNAVKHNLAVARITEEVLKNLKRARYSALAKIEDDIDLSDHNQCSSAGYNLKNSQSSESYYHCRQKLILSKIPVNPEVLNNFDLSNRADEYFRIFQERLNNREALIVANMIKKYPNCVGLNIYSNDFKKCSDAAERSDQCLAGTDSMQDKKKFQDKIYCQRQSVLKFPDIMISQKSEAEKTNQSDNVTLLYLQGEKAAREGSAKEKESDNKKRNKQRLYNRIQVMQLRERFIYQCDKEMEDKMPDFISQYTENCLNIAKNWANKGS